MTLKKQLLLFLLIITLTTATTTNTPNPQNPIQITYITTQNCQICEYQEQYHQQLQKNYTDQIQIKTHHIKDLKQEQENPKLNKTIETAPTTIINNKIYQGFNSNIKHEIQNKVTNQLGEPPKNNTKKPKDNSTIQKINQLLQEIIN